MPVENPLNNFIKPVRTLGKAPSEKQKLKIIKDIRFKAAFTHTINRTASYLSFNFARLHLSETQAIAYFLLCVSNLLSHLLQTTTNVRQVLIPVVKTLHVITLSVSRSTLCQLYHVFIVVHFFSHVLPTSQFSDFVSLINISDSTSLNCQCMCT